MQLLRLWLTEISEIFLLTDSCQRFSTCRRLAWNWWKIWLCRGLFL